MAVPPGKVMIVSKGEFDAMLPKPENAENDEVQGESADENSASQYAGMLKNGRFAAFNVEALELKFGKGSCENAVWRRRESGEYMEISASKREAKAKSPNSDEKQVTLKLGMTTSEQNKPLTKKLQDIFVDDKVPKEDRDRIYFGAIGAEVLFIPEQQGIARPRWSTGFKVTQGTKRVLVFVL